MKEWLKRLFHFHTWETVQHINLTETGRPFGDRYILKCTICGSYKKQDIY